MTVKTPMENNTKPQTGKIRAKERNRARLHFLIPPLSLLLLILLAVAVFSFSGLKSVSGAIPLITVIFGIIIILIGAFYDFGAKIYLENLFTAKAKFSEKDMIQIHREQFIMTAIYIGIGLLFIATGYVLSYILGIFGIF